MFNYAKLVSPKATPQSEPIPGSPQVPNSAGGYSFEVDDWVKLDRFLILGTEGGSYYADERKLTLQAADAVLRCLAADGPRTVGRIAEISQAGRAPKNDPAIFALALALKKGDTRTRGHAAAAVSSVCRIGTHIFQLAEAVKQLGGWGRNTKGAFGDWYLKQSISELQLNLVKYQQRNGWAHRDLLRKSHAVPQHHWQNALFRYAVGKPVDGLLGAFPLINAFEEAKLIAKEGVSRRTVEQICGLIMTNGLPRECVPTEFLNDLDVWDALLHSGKHGMPMTAMIRNLGKMTAVGLAKPLSEPTKFICDRLRDLTALKHARVHPLQVLIALATYRQGHGDKGQLSWSPSQEIVAALNDAFYLSFAAVEPTNKRWLIALDVSGSMDSGRVAGSNLTPREAAAALAMVTVRTEPRFHVVGFTSSGGGYGGKWDSGRSGLTQIPFTPHTELTEACRMAAALPMGGTDCALPMIYAQQNKLEVDAFMVLTDNETWAGKIHPVQALRSYRQSSGIGAKLIVNGMVVNDFTIADPTDAGMLDVVGFDSAAPAIMADFVRG